MRQAIRHASAAFVIAVALAFGGVSQVVAQNFGSVQSPVLVVESDRLYIDSAFGLRIASEVEARSVEIATENRRIEAELEAEEKELTEQRETLSPEDFRDLADAFDAKVRKTRETQEAKARALARALEDGRNVFLQAAAPVLEAMMREAGAAVVLERRNVFLSLNAIDITTTAIARIDAEIGDGLTLDDQDAAPDTPEE